MAKLNTEIAIRNDFVTLALEAVRAMPSAELQANFVSWVDNMGFVGTITTDPRLCSVDDIRPLRLQLVKGGVVGMLDLPAVQDYYAKVAPLCANAKSKPAPAPAEWDAFVRGLDLPDQLLRFVPELATLDAKLWEHNNRALGAAMQYEPAPVPESASFKYWPSAQTRGQRPIGEHAHDRKQEDQILAALSFLQGEGHLMNIADTVKLEMVPKTFDKYENDVVEASDPAYTQLRQLLDDLIAMPSNSAQRLMEMFKRTVSADLRMLRNALAIKKVKVWVADKRVFFFKNNMDDRIGEGVCVCVCVYAFGRQQDNNITRASCWIGCAAADSLAGQIALQRECQNRYLAMFEDSANETNVYVARDHPALSEAVLHCFFKSRGYTQAECVLLEMLVEAQVHPGATFAPPRRVVWELDNAPHEDLAELILNTRATMRRIRANTALDDGQRAVLEQLATGVLRHARAQLLDAVDMNIAAMDHVAEMMQEPARAVDRQLGELLGYSTIRSRAKDLFLALVQAVTKAAAAGDKDKDADTDASRAAMVKYMHGLIHSAFQRVSLKELALKVAQKNPLPLPERDQVTVNIEMLVSRDKINFLFGLSSNQLGSIVYNALRSKIVKAEVIGRKNETKTEVVDTRGPAAFFQRLASGMFFTIPALLDVILVLFVGSGVFSSNLMSQPAVDVVNLSFLVVFSSMGGVMNSIARVCAYYFSQYSVPLMLAAAVRRFTAGTLVAIVTSIATAVIIVLMHPPVWAILEFFYTFTFSVFIMAMAGMATSRNATVGLLPIWMKPAWC
jgi:hypothetical protein